MARRDSHKLLVAAAAVLVAAISVVSAFAARKASSAASEEARLKAEYIFLEAADAYESERYDDYYMLLRRAHALDPSDVYIAGAMGEIELVSSMTDSMGRERAYRGVLDRFYANPSDYHYGLVAASVAKDSRRYADIRGIWATLDSIFPDRTEPALNLASVYLVEYILGDTAAYRKSLDIYRRLQHGLPGDIALASCKIRAFAAARDTASIVSELGRLQKEAPASVDANLFIGSNFAGIGMGDSAMAFFDRAAAMDPSNGTVYLARADYFRQKGDSSAYDREVFEALESPTLEFEPKFDLLTKYVQTLYADTLQRPRIEELFRVLQDVNPGEPDLHAFYGAYKTTIGQPAEAAEQYSYCVALDPENEDAWQAMVMSYGSAGDTEHLLSAAREAMTRFPSQLYFPMAATGGLVLEKRLSEALELLDSVNPADFINDRQRSLYHGQRGDILYALELPDSAIVEYDKAVNLDPENYMAMNNAAYYMSERSQNLDRASLYASLAVDSDPQNPTYLDTYAWVLFKKKEYRKAREVMDRALRIYHLIEDSTATAPAEIPEDSAAVEDEIEVGGEVSADNVAGEPSVEIFDHAGDIYYMSGEPGEALRFWKAALELTPDDPVIRRKVKEKAYFFE